MKTFLELAGYFYGKRIPRFSRKKFYALVLEFLSKEYSIETAIGLALKKLRIV